MRRRGGYGSYKDGQQEARSKRAHCLLTEQAIVVAVRLFSSSLSIRLLTTSKEVERERKRELTPTASVWLLGVVSRANANATETDEISRSGNERTIRARVENIT